MQPSTMASAVPTLIRKASWAQVRKILIPGSDSHTSPLDWWIGSEMMEKEGWRKIYRIYNNWAGLPPGRITEEKDDLVWIGYSDHGPFTSAAIFTARPPPYGIGIVAIRSRPLRDKRDVPNRQPGPFSLPKKKLQKHSRRVTLIWRVLFKAMAYLGRGGYGRYGAHRKKNDEMVKIFQQMSRQIEVLTQLVMPQAQVGGVPATAENQPINSIDINLHGTTNNHPKRGLARLG